MKFTVVCVKHPILLFFYWELRVSMYNAILISYCRKLDHLVKFWRKT